MRSYPLAEALHSTSTRLAQVMATKELGRSSPRMKIEEVNTELDLRLHLHEPRPSRIKQDLHHVRAAELESHHDRISRHSKRLIASIGEQKATIQDLVSQQELESDKFSAEVMKLEQMLESAEKIIKLLKIQDEAKCLLEKHLQHVSSISATHQSHCEELLGELEDSNRSYKASLKRFSEGGNYCPEEVEQYTKKLTKLSSKVTSAKTVISNEVAVLAKSHCEAAWEVMKQFEASYLLHSADLSFLEEVSQTLTSAQVGIKSEVARSNSQAREIFQNIDKIAATIKQVQAKDVPCSTLVNEVSTFFTVLSRRADYLFCWSSQLRGARVGSHAEVIPSPSLAKSSAAPISAVNITRSILEQTSAKKNFDSATDKEMSKQQTKTAIRIQVQAGQEHRETISGVTSGLLHPTAPEIQQKSARQSISSRKRTLAMERKHTTFGIGGGDDGTDCFLPQVREVLKSSHQELYHKAENYYKVKGTCPPTRPDQIQESFEDCIDSLILKCQLYRAQAEEYRNDCIEEFRRQLETSAAVLELVPRVTFDVVKEEQLKIFNEARKARNTSHNSIMKDLASTKESHENSLRPTLGHPNQRERLDDLCSEEEGRHTASLKCSNDHALESKIVEGQFVVKFILKIVETTKTLLSLFDSLTISADIVPGSDRHKNKPQMEKLLWSHINQQSATSTSEDTEGGVRESASALIPSKLSGKTSGYVWPHLPKAERTAIMEMLPPPPNTSSKRISANNGVRSTTSRKKMNASRMSNVETPPALTPEVADRRASCSSNRRASLSQKQVSSTVEAELAKLLAEKLVSSKWTSVHEVIIRTRDETIQGCMTSYQDHVSDINEQQERELQVENKWCSNWASSVNKIKQLYS